MIKFFGFAILIASVVMLLLPKNNAPTFIKNWTTRKTIMGGVLGLILIVIQGAFFINPPGTVTAVQYLWGGDNVVNTQGLKLKWWGRTIPISYELALQDYIQKYDEGGEPIPVNKEEGIYYRKADTREFADAIKGMIASSIIVTVDYTVDEDFAKMADNIRSEEKLVHSRIYPVYDQAVKNTCKLMDAQDYISGASAQFDYYLKDQMVNGMYLTEEVYEDLDETEIVEGDTTKTVAKASSMKDKRRKKYRIRTDSNGNPIRDESTSLKRYGLSVPQATITGLDWEASFDKRLQRQKEQVAQTQIEKQEAEKEYYATQKAIAKGEREKAETRIAKEKEMIEQTLDAETKAAAAKFREQEESNLLAAARKKALRVKVQADAEAYEISKKVKAGITPEVKLKMEIDGRVRMMEALAGENGITLPKTMFVGSEGSKNGNNGMLESILGAKILSGEIGVSEKQ